MYILICYDVSTTTPEGKKRLNKVAKVCSRYGQRVQNSTFECLINSSELLILKQELKKIMCADEDTIRIYRLPKKYFDAIEILGIDRSIHLENPTVI